jgi:hypothetical protein
MRPLTVTGTCRYMTGVGLVLLSAWVLSWTLHLYAYRHIGMATTRAGLACARRLRQSAMALLVGLDGGHAIEWRKGRRT